MRTYAVINRAENRPDTRPEVDHYVLGFEGGEVVEEHGPMTAHNAERYRDYLADFPRHDPRD